MTDDCLPLREELPRHGNDHRFSTRAWEATADGIGWHDPTPSDCWLASSRTVSVVIPAHQVGYCLPTVLDAVDSQHHQHRVEVIVVDDASTDDTAEVAMRHPVVDRLVRLPERMGAATARNVGTALASGQTVLYLDGDMVIPPHVITNIATRATDTSVLVGFRHNLRYEAHFQDPHVLTRVPDLAADHRVTWRPPTNMVLPYSGITLLEPLDGRPLAHTRDFIDLGYGQRYHDWDLPRMVVTALVAVPRAAVLHVGGFDPEFGRLGWGMEDTYLGACLIAAGLLVIPLRQVVGFHLDPPDAAEQWRHKLAGWPRTLARYRALLELPAPQGRAEHLKRGRRHIGPDDVRSRYHVTPAQWADFRALTGDPADNIPGVRGVGVGTAATLLAGGLTLDELPASGRLTGAKGAAIRGAWEQILAWRDLIRMRTDLDLPLLPTGRPSLALPTPAKVIDALGLW
ncbi:glycosyltransferase [Streptoalloteichus hindustanus]|nr:glycosyltransferase [Streptoalloteichus hindustanus]